MPEAEPVGQQLEERAAARLPRLRVGSQGLGVRGWILGIRVTVTVTVRVTVRVRVRVKVRVRVRGRVRAPGRA